MNWGVAFMAAVTDYMDGSCRIVIYDDYCVKTQREADEILESVAGVYRRHYIGKALKEAEEAYTAKAAEEAPQKNRRSPRI